MIYKYLNRIYGYGDVYLRLAGVLKTYSSSIKVISGYSDFYTLIQKSYVATAKTFDLLNKLSAALLKQNNLLLKQYVGVQDIKNSITQSTIAEIVDYRSISKIIDSIYDQIELCNDINVGIDEVLAINLTSEVGLLNKVDLTQKLLVGVSKILALASSIMIGMSKEFNMLLEQITANKEVINITAKQINAVLEAYHQNMKTTIGLVKDFTEALKIIVGNAIELSNVLTTSRIGHEVIFGYTSKIIDSLYTTAGLLVKAANGVEKDITQNLTLGVGEEIEIASLLDEVATILRKAFGYRAVVSELKRFTTDVQLIADKATIEELEKLLADIEMLDKLRLTVEEYRKLR